MRRFVAVVLATILLLPASYACKNKADTSRVRETAGTAAQQASSPLSDVEDRLSHVVAGYHALLREYGSLAKECREVRAQHVLLQRIVHQLESDMDDIVTVVTQLRLSVEAASRSEAESASSTAPLADSVTVPAPPPTLSDREAISLLRETFDSNGRVDTENHCIEVVLASRDDVADVQSALRVVGIRGFFRRVAVSSSSDYTEKGAFLTDRRGKVGARVAGDDVEVEAEAESYTGVAGSAKLNVKGRQSTTVQMLYIRGRDAVEAWYYKVGFTRTEDRNKAAEVMLYLRGGIPR